MNKKKWIWQTMFHYCDIDIYTDSQTTNWWDNNVELHYVPYPNKIAEKLNDILGIK
jgi:hypothetical protein